MRQGKSYYFFAVLILPLVIFIRHPQAVESFHNVSSMLMKPALEAGSTVTNSAVDMRDHMSVFWQTFRQNLTFSEQVEKLRAQVLYLEEAKRENQRLKKLLALKESIPSKTFAARVIGWDPSMVRKAVLLDKGKNDKIRKDMPVVAEEGLIGRVVEVSAGTAKVLLLIDPDMRVGGITSLSRSQGIVAGNGNSSLTLQYLDPDSGVAIGEDVITSGASGLFPKGLRIGKVTSIEKSSDGLHLMASVQPDVPFSKLEEVLCLDFSPRK